MRRSLGYNLCGGAEELEEKVTTPEKAEEAKLKTRFFPGPKTWKFRFPNETITERTKPL